ncbi:MAG: type II secretion system F family protein [Caldilineaceae bacterium]|nr:type II secretion system F family protein [Caldilineaceae bacterium]
MARSTAPDMRQMKLRQPFSERVAKPILRQLYGMGRYLTPSTTISQIQQRLIIAGLPGGMTVTDFLGLRVLVGASLSGVVFAMMISSKPPFQALLFAAGAFLVGLYIPNMWLSSKAKSRQKAIARALPDMLDMMSICVDAGLGFEAALQKVAFQSDNELALELRRVISEIRVGVSRGDALRHLAERTQVPDVASFVAVLVQADRLGIAIRNVLNTQSVQMRIKRRQRAEEAAGQAGIKMLIPLAFFIFPAMFAVILGPAIPRLMEAFK